MVLANNSGECLIDLQAGNSVTLVIDLLTGVYDLLVFVLLASNGFILGFDILVLKWLKSLINLQVDSNCKYLRDMAVKYILSDKFFPYTFPNATIAQRL